MRNHLRVMTIIALLFMFIMSLPSGLLAQDNPTITVTPASGQVGSAILDIAVDGLVDGQTYTIEFVYEGVVVFATDEEADEDGIVTFIAASSPDDEAGTYTVQVVSNNSIIAATEFQLTGESTDTDSATDGTPQFDSTGNIRINPASGPISTVHSIRISDLDIDTNYTVEITATATETVVYRRIWTSDENGVVSIEIFAEDGDTPGVQTVSVFDTTGNLVAQGQFNIDEPPLRDVTADISPTVGEAGREFTITVSGLAQFDSVTAQITSSTNILVDTVTARASSGGVAILSFLSPDDLDEGMYDVGIFVDDTRMTSATFTIGDAPPATDDTSISVVSLSVEPEMAPLGSTHVMSIAGLESNQAFTLTISNTAGEIEYTTPRIADESGEFSINITSSEDDEPGSYPVEITDSITGDVLATAQMIIAGDILDSSGGDTTAQVGTPSISVSPDSGEIGTIHVIALSGMPIGERVGVIIRAQSDDTLALSSAITPDDNGEGAIEFTSRDLNNPGVYTVTATQPAGELASATFTIDGAVATVEPQSGPIGTTHEISVMGLNPDETVTFDVAFGGETVYETDSTADANGEASLRLATDEGDEPGDFIVTVVRDAGNQPTVIITVTEEAEDESAEDDGNDESVDSDSDAQVIEGTLSADVEEISFSGEEGQYIVISVESDDFDTVATVYDSDSFEIAYNDDSLNELNSRIGPLMLPYTGDYTLEVSASVYTETTTEGDFVAVIHPITVSPIESGDSVPFVLSSDSPAVYYELTVNAGDSLDIRVDSGGTIDTVLQVLYSDGFEFAYDDDSGAGFDAEFTDLIFDFQDTFIIALSTFDDAQSGEGTLTIIRNPVKSLDDGEVTVTLNDKKFRDVVVFEAEEGQLVTLNLEKLSGEVQDFYVYANIDGTQVMSYSTMGVPDNLPLVFVMPMSGQVTVSFEEFGFSDGISLSVSVERE